MDEGNSIKIMKDEFIKQRTAELRRQLIEVNSLIEQTREQIIKEIERSISKKIELMKIIQEANVSKIGIKASIDELECLIVHERNMK